MTRVEVFTDCQVCGRPVRWIGKRAYCPASNTIRHRLRVWLRRVRGEMVWP